MKFIYIVLTCFITTCVFSASIKPADVKRDILKDTGDFKSLKKGEPVSFKLKRNTVVKGKFSSIKGVKIYVEIEDGVALGYRFEDISDDDAWKLDKKLFDAKIKTLVNAEISKRKEENKLAEAKAREEQAKKQEEADRIKNLKASLDKYAERQAFADFNFGDSREVTLYKIEHSKGISIKPEPRPEPKPEPEAQPEAAPAPVQAPPAATAEGDNKAGEEINLEELGIDLNFGPDPNNKDAKPEAKKTADSKEAEAVQKDVPEEPKSDKIICVTTLAGRDCDLIFTFSKNDQLIKLSLDFVPLEDAAFDTGLKADWLLMKTIITKKYKEPKKTAEYPDKGKLNETGAFYTDTWDIEYKQIQVGIVKNDIKYNSEIEISDLKADELARKKILLEQEKQAAKDAQMF